MQENWQSYKKYFKFWKLAIGLPALKGTALYDDGLRWRLWFNFCDEFGIWWQG